MHKGSGRQEKKTLLETRNSIPESCYATGEKQHKQERRHDQDTHQECSMILKMLSLNTEHKNLNWKQC